MLGKYGGKVWTGFIWLRIGISSGDEPSDSIKGGEFIDLSSQGFWILLSIK
jgi:hypothetical protein